MDTGVATSDNPWAVEAILCKSDDGINWEIIKRLPNLGNFRDGFVLPYKDFFYLVSGTYVVKTKDFVNFEHVETGLNDNPFLSYVWAGEFVVDENKKYWLVNTAVKNNGDNNPGTSDDLFNDKRSVFLNEFDPETGQISNGWNEVDVDCGSDIDSDITYYNGKYYMWMNRNHLYTSDSLFGPYDRTATNLDSNYHDYYEEGPEMIFTNEGAYLYYDRIWGNSDHNLSNDNPSGYRLRKALDNTLTHWSDPIRTRCSFDLRHGCFIYNGKKPNLTEYFPEIKQDSSLGTKVI